MRPLQTTILLVLTALLVVVLLSAPAVGEGGAASRLVARIGRDSVLATDVVDFWYARYREGWIRTLENLVDERIVDHEVRRLGLTLPPGVLQKAIDEEVKARQEQLVSTYGEGANLVEVVRDGYGMDLAAWKRNVLSPRLRVQHLLQRVVRLDGRRRERVKVRVIVLPDEAKARRVLRKLETGADFSLTALKESVDPTAQAGGDLPSVARGDLTLTEVENQLFAAGPGALVGPLAVDLGGGTRWHIYKVIERRPPWTGTRAALLARLEKDLEELPLQRGEFERWRARARRDFRVQVFDPGGRSVVLPSAGR